MTISAPMRLELWPNGNPKPEQRNEVAAAHERLAGRDPRGLSAEDFASIGHERQPLLAVIRQNCIECQSGSQAEVRHCRATGCVFWPYRMGSNPFPSPARVEAGRRLALSRQKSATQAGDFGDEDGFRSLGSGGMV